MSFDTLSEVGAGAFFSHFASTQLIEWNSYNSRQNGEMGEPSCREWQRHKRKWARRTERENKQNIINTFVAHSSHRRCTARKRICRKQNYINIDYTTPSSRCSICTLCFTVSTLSWCKGSHEAFSSSTCCAAKMVSDGEAERRRPERENVCQSVAAIAELLFSLAAHQRQLRWKR